MIDFEEPKVSQKPEKLFEVVFSETYAEIAKTITYHIKKYGSLRRFEVGTFSEDHGFSKRTVFKVLEKMQKLGMIYKSEGRYILSRRFGNALNRLYKAWKKLLEEV